MRTAIQLYTIRNVGLTMRELLERVGETSFDGVEFAYRVYEEPAADVRETMDAQGLVAASSHVRIDDLEQDMESEIEMAKAIGYDDIAVPMIGPDGFETVADVEETAERLNGLADRLGDHDIRLHYHNHEHEFVETEAGRAFDVLADRTEDVYFEIDPGWALAGGADPVDLLHRYEDRITHVHFKDVDVEAGEPETLGKGDLDLAAVTDAVHDIDAEWLIFENDNAEEPLKTLDHGAALLSQYV